MLECLTYKYKEVQLHTLHFGIKTIVDKGILLSSLLLIINGALSPSIHMLEIADVYINHVTMVQTGLSFNPQMDPFDFILIMSLISTAKKLSRGKFRHNVVT